MVMRMAFAIVAPENFSPDSLCVDLHRLRINIYLADEIEFINREILSIIPLHGLKGKEELPGLIRVHSLILKGLVKTRKK